MVSRGGEKNVQKTGRFIKTIFVMFKKIQLLLTSSLKPVLFVLSTQINSSLEAQRLKLEHLNLQHYNIFSPTTAPKHSPNRHINIFNFTRKSREEKTFFLLLFLVK